MPQFIKKREEAPEGSTTSGDPNAPECPNCGSRKTTVTATMPGRLLLRCDACGFHFAIATDGESNQR